MWYNYNKLFSYKALLNMIIGMRGGGKTYGAKKWAVRDFLRNGNQFVWVRRFGNELELALKGFFNALKNDGDLIREFGEIEYNIVGSDLYINGEKAGVGIPLFSSSKYKSAEYPRVNKIIYDEFLVEKGSSGYYLKGEVDVLFGLIETIQRHRDNVRVVMIANSVSFSNPYFMFFRIKPFSKEYLHLKDRSVLVHLYYNEEFASHKKSTRFGKLIADTSYENYAVNNNFVDLSGAFIEKKSVGVVFSCSVRYESVDYGFWVDNNRGLMYASLDVDPSGREKYVISEVEHDINYQLVTNYRGTRLLQIMTYYEHGWLRFEDNVVKSGVLALLSVL